MTASLPIPDEFVEAIAERAAELIERQAGPEDGWLRGAGRIARYIDAPRVGSTRSPPRGASTSTATAAA